MANLESTQLKDGFQTLVSIGTTTVGNHPSNPLLGALTNGKGNALTQVTLALGSASAPSYSFTGDVDTGMFSSGANVLNLATGGNNRMTIASGGNISIGTANSSAKLQVGISSEEILRLERDTTTNDSFIDLTYASGHNNDSDANHEYSKIRTKVVANLSGLESSELHFQTINVGTIANKMVISKEGNVGIGGTPASISATARWLTLNADSGSSASGGIIHQVDGTTKGAQYVFGSNVYHDAKSGIGHQFAVNNGTNAMTIDTSGEVGIGTTNPSTPLNVAGSSGGGSIKISGDMSAGAYYYGYMFDGSSLQGTTQTNIFYAGGAVKADTTITDFASLRIDAPSTAASNAVITNNYGIYQASTAQKNVFNGNVGIGTSSIDGTLHLDAGTSSDLVIEKDDAGYASVRFHNGGSQVSYIQLDNNEDMVHYGGSGVNQIIYAGGSERMRIDSSGNTSIYSGVLNLGSDSVASSLNCIGDVFNISVDSDGNSGGSPNMRFNVSGSEKMRIDSSGNVGIGTDSLIDILHLKEAGGANIRFENPTTGRHIRIGEGVGTTDVFSFRGSGVGTDTLSIDFANNRVGVGTISPDDLLELTSDGSNAAGAVIRLTHANNNNTDVIGTVNFANNVGSAAMIQAGTTGANNTGYISFFTDNAGTSAEKMRIIGDGKVGIGTTSPSQPLTVVGNAFVSSGLLLLSDNQDIRWGDAGERITGHNTNGLIFTTNNAERIRLFSDGDVSFMSVSQNRDFYWDAGNSRLGIGTTTPDAELQIMNNDSSSYRFGYGGTSDVYLDTDNIYFRSDNGGANYGILQNGKLGLGTLAPSQKLEIHDASATTTANDGGVGIAIKNTNGTDNNQASLEFQNSNGTKSASIIATFVDQSSNEGILSFGTGPGGGAFAEAMRIDSSGNVLVGKITTSNADAGIELNNTGQLVGTFASGSHILGRNTTDGAILTFNKDNTAVGSIGVGNSNDLYIGNADTGLCIQDNERISPWNPSTNAIRDNAINFGDSDRRFKDIYATNGTIQTSDVNEKQDIEELNDAELRVAQQAKTLLRKFRWTSSVEEKGDDARVHFGIIAQDLEQAFTDEGLDAGRYGMFIKSTWTNEDGEEQTRLGVRYNQLLAFIISSI